MKSIKLYMVVHAINANSLTPAVMRKLPSRIIYWSSPPHLSQNSRPSKVIPPQSGQIILAGAILFHTTSYSSSASESASVFAVALWPVSLVAGSL
jgi:hypothetical protein